MQLEIIFLKFLTALFVNLTPFIILLHGPVAFNRWAPARTCDCWLYLLHFPFYTVRFYSCHFISFSSRLLEKCKAVAFKLSCTAHLVTTSFMSFIPYICTTSSLVVPDGARSCSVSAWPLSVSCLRRTGFQRYLKDIAGVNDNLIF